MDRAKTCPPSNPAEISPFIRLVPSSWFILRVQLLNVCNVRPFVGEIFLWLDLALIADVIMVHSCH
jgi:hypothetical protein